MGCPTDSASEKCMASKYKRLLDAEEALGAAGTGLEVK